MRRKLAVIMVTLMLAGVMAACGKSGAVETNVSTEETETEEKGIVGTFSMDGDEPITFAADGTFVWEREDVSVEGTYELNADEEWFMSVDGNVKWSVTLDSENQVTIMSEDEDGDFYFLERE